MVLLGVGRECKSSENHFKSRLSWQGSGASSLETQEVAHQPYHLRNDPSLRMVKISPGLASEGKWHFLVVLLKVQSFPKLAHERRKLVAWYSASGRITGNS